MTPEDDPQAVGAAVRAHIKTGDVASALELFARKWRVWLAGGDVRDAMEIASIALEADGAQAVEPWRARALYADGLFAFRAGEMARSAARNDELLRVAKPTGDARGECGGPTGPPRLAVARGRADDLGRCRGQAHRLGRGEAAIRGRRQGARGSRDGARPGRRTRARLAEGPSHRGDMLTTPIPPGRVLVAVSGGPDSTALLVALHEAGRDVVAAHYDHALHDGSDAVARDVGDLCARLGVEV